ncbi:MAG: isoprenyl transferase [Thermodesulfobacteriota bacterium]
MSTKTTRIVDKKKIPKHVVLIMDGNGRWAEKRKLSRITGHREGMKSVSSIVKASKEVGIKYITLFAFSAQNWNRPKKEVVALMDLLKQFLLQEGPRLIEQDIKLNAIGRLNKLPKEARDTLNLIIKNTRKCKSMTLTLALSYGSREEIVDAVRIIAEKGYKPGNITEKTIGNNLYTSDMPDPDLLIRTSGEQRISNFMLWQLAYTEIYVTKTLWPNFRKKHFINAILNYQNRERRFGLTGKQIKKRD